MMRIAILGATSQIARDLIVSFSASADTRLHLFARRTEAMGNWLASVGLSERYPVDDFSGFGTHEFDAVINFVGVGDPAQALMIGDTISDITSRFDEMVLTYLQQYPACRYLFLSSGAAYGSSFNEPASHSTVPVAPTSNPTSHEWYGAAKFEAEYRHRAHPELSIFDIRVFNYFSHRQNLDARFLITDILRAIRDKTVLKTSSEYIVRDYLHPTDFYNLVNALLCTNPANAAVDCYTLAPIDKPNLLAAMQNKFGLRYEVTESAAGVNATGSKPYYYSLNTQAASFGYLPLLTSLEGILKETEIALASYNLLN